jgi:hypothetical protein
MKVKESCGHIERYGKMRNLADTEAMKDGKKCLAAIARVLEDVKKEFAHAEIELLKLIGVEH